MEEKLDARGLNEAQAIARYRSRNYPKPALTADVVILSPTGEGLKVLLIERGGHPYLGCLAFPGGFAQEDESIEETAARELQEETGVSGLALELIGVYSRPGRDPRGWVVSAAFLAIVEEEKLALCAGDDAADARWYTIVEENGELFVCHGETRLSAADLAFDHQAILEDALGKYADLMEQNR